MPAPNYLPTVESQNSSTTTSSNQTQTQTPDPLAKLSYEQTLANANQIAQTPYEQYGGEMVAGFTPDQTAGFEGIRQMQGVQTPYIGQAGNLYQQMTNTWQNPMLGQAQNYFGTSFGYIPNAQMPAVQNYTTGALSNAINQQMPTAQNYFEKAMAYTPNTQLPIAQNYFGQAMAYTPNTQMSAAQNYLGQAMNLATNLELPTTREYYNQSFRAAANPYLNQAGDWSTQSVGLSNLGNFDQQALSRYMNPYQQSVVDATLAQMKQNQDVLQNQNTANAIRQGAYGGSGQFMGQAELGRQQALANAQTLAQLNAQNYAQAMGQYNQQQQAAIQARQNAAQLMGQLGQSQAGLNVNALQQAAQTLGQLGQSQAGLQSGAAQQAAQILGQLGQSQAALQAGTAAQAGQTLGQLGQSQAALQAGTAAQAGQTMGQLGQSQAQLLAGTGMDAAKLYGQLGAQEAERGIQAYQNAAQNLGQLGQQQQALGVQALNQAAAGVAGLGEQAQKAKLADLQALLSAGQMQQQLNQQQNAVDYNQWLQAKAYPYQQTSYFAGLAQGLGPLLGNTINNVATGTSNTSSSGTSIAPYQQQQSGGGIIPGLIQTGLSFLPGIGSLFKADGGSVTGRKSYADGGEADEEGFGSFAQAASQMPYSSSSIETPVNSKVGLGALMTSAPYTAPDDYISEASKLANVIKPAGRVAREQIQSQLDKVLDVIPGSKKATKLDFEGGNMKKFPKYGSEQDDGFDYAKLGESLGSIVKMPKVKSFVSEKLSDLGSLFSQDRDGYADGGTPQEQYQKSQTAQQQAQQVMGDYQKYFGRPADQPGFEYWTQQAASGVAPEQIAANMQNSPERMRNVREAYVDFLGRAPDVEGYDYWTGLAKNGATFGDLQGAIQHSPESMYHNILNRTADKEGYNYWRNQLQSGLDPSTLDLYFTQSPEYVNKSSQPVSLQDKITQGFAALDPSAGMNKALAREKMIDPTAKPMSNYDMLLQQAMRRNPGPQLTPEQQGMPSMPEPDYYSRRSPSYQGAVGGNLNLAGSMNVPEKYVEPAAPPPTEAETALSNARNAYNAAVSNAQSQQQVMALGLAQSGINPAIAVQLAVSAIPTPAAPASLGDLEEAVKNQPPREAPANPYTNFIKSTYKNYLGRDPSADEINAQMEQLKAGIKPSELESQILGSSEGKNTNYIKQLYSDVLGRPSDLGGLEYWKNQLAEGVPASELARQFEQSGEYSSVPAAFRGTGPVQGYYARTASRQFNPYTGLFNREYIAPYRNRQVSNFLPRQDGGRVEKAAGGSRGTKLSMQEIARAALQAGATPQEAAILTAIAMPESSGVYNIHNFKGRDESYGLWQINMLGAMGPERMRQFGLSSKSDLYDPVTNAKAALQLLRGRGGLKNWTTYTSGKFKPYYSAALDAVRQIAGNSEEINKPLPKFSGESVGTESVAPPRRGFFSRLASEFSPVGTAYADESTLSRINPADPSGPLLPEGERPKISRGPGENRIMHRQGLGITQQPQGYPTFARQPEWSTSSMGLSPERMMLPETPEKVSSKDFPMSMDPWGSSEIKGPTEEVAASDASTSGGAAKSKPTQKYWGDYRDVENNPIGDFIDELAGDVRASEKRGTAQTPMGKFAGQGGLGALFDLEGTGGYAEPAKKRKDEEASDFGGLFDFFS